MPACWFKLSAEVVLLDELVLLVLASVPLDEVEVEESAAGGGGGIPIPPADCDCCDWSTLMPLAWSVWSTAFLITVRKSVESFDCSAAWRADRIADLIWLCSELELSVGAVLLDVLDVSEAVVVADVFRLCSASISRYRYEFEMVVLRLLTPLIKHLLVIWQGDNCPAPALAPLVNLLR
jgi:hypothetical protein